MEQYILTTTSVLSCENIKTAVKQHIVKQTSEATNLCFPVEVLKVCLSAGYFKGKDCQL